MKKINSDDKFVQEYLYIEQYVPNIPKKEKESEKLEDDERGVVIVDIFSNQEEISVL